MAQKQTERSKTSTKESTVTADPKKVETSVNDEALDALLDEIDNVLEVNAEEFVAAYIQKGGQ